MIYKQTFFIHVDLKNKKTQNETRDPFPHVNSIRSEVNAHASCALTTRKYTVIHREKSRVGLFPGLGYVL